MPVPNFLSNLKTRWYAATPRITRVVGKAERSLHVPYFAGTAWHYGVDSIIGGSAGALLLASVMAIFAEGKKTGGDS